VGGLHDPVPDRHVADPERAEEVRICGHGPDRTLPPHEVQPNVRLPPT
jgi:hypothetical protein